MASTTAVLAPAQNFHSFFDRSYNPWRRKDTAAPLTSTFHHTQYQLEEQDDDFSVSDYHPYYRPRSYSRDDSTVQHAINKKQGIPRTPGPAIPRNLEEEASRDTAVTYLRDFLDTSEWQHMLDRISIVEDDVPTMEELESYASLDESAGTLKCRRLFKAVVVWEQVGRSLWERLREDKAKQELEDAEEQDPLSTVRDVTFSVPEQQRQAQSQGLHPPRAIGNRELNALSIILEQPNEPLPPRRSSATSSLASCSRRSSLNPTISNTPSSRTTVPSSPSSTSLTKCDSYPRYPIPSLRRPFVTHRRSSSLPGSRSRQDLEVSSSTNCSCCNVANVTENVSDDVAARRSTDAGHQIKSDFGAWGFQSETLRGDTAEDSQSSRRGSSSSRSLRKASAECVNAVKRKLGVFDRGSAGASLVKTKRHGSVG